MRTIVTDRVAWSVGLSVGLVSPAKTAEPIEMSFGLRTRMGPGNHVLDGVQIPHGKGHFWGEKGHPIVKHRDSTAICAKTTEPIEMPFGLWVRMGPRNHKIIIWDPDPAMGRSNFGERVKVKGKGQRYLKR